jgi:probable HAF family extracellular repeat protein
MTGRDINDAGDILGLVSVDGAFRVAVWTRATGQITPIDAAIEPSAFNEQGWIAGTSADVPNRAARWTPTEGVVAITPVGANADARDLNDAGHVVGHVDGNAYLWTPENGVRPLPLPDGATASFATAINDRDEVVGYVDRADGQQHAFYWSAVTGTIDLGTLGGRISFAADINDSGTVVGHAQAVNDGPMRIFTWSAVGGMVDLGTIGYQSNATAINNHGTIIGNWFDGSDPNFRRGFIFTPTAGMLDIGAAPRNRSALAIALNEADQVIVADEQVLLWAPTPG